MSEALAPTWTIERREQVVKFWNEGLVASQIVVALGKPYVTRGAVVGIISRAGLHRGRPQRRERKATPYAERVSLPPLAITPNRVSVPEPVSLCVPLLELKPWHCRWPSEGLPTTSCGAPQIAWPYCEHHAQRAFVPAVARRRVAQ